MARPVLIKRGHQGRLVLSEGSFVEWVCRRRLHQSDITAAHPEVTKKILNNSCALYRPKYHKILESIHKEHLAKAARNRPRRQVKAPPSVLLDKDELLKLLEQGIPVCTIADTLGTSEWYVIRNCEHYGYSQEFIAANVVSPEERSRLLHLFPYLDTGAPSEAALERAMVENRRVAYLLCRLGASKATISTGEAYVAEQLIERGIQYIREHYITPHRAGPGNRRVDFFLPDFNTAIEVNGQYHRLQGERDAEVASLCSEAGITLLVFPYTSLTKAFRLGVCNALDSLHH